MSAIPQQVLAGQKASLDNLLAIQGSFFGGFEKLVALNLKVIKATLDEVAQKSQQAIEVKAAQEALAFTSGLVQPNADKALPYSKNVSALVPGVQGVLSTHTTEENPQRNQHVIAHPEQI